MTNSMPRWIRRTGRRRRCRICQISFRSIRVAYFQWHPGIKVATLENLRSTRRIMQHTWILPSSCRWRANRIWIFISMSNTCSRIGRSPPAQDKCSSRETILNFWSWIWRQPWDRILRTASSLQSAAAAPTTTVWPTRGHTPTSTSSRKIGQLFRILTSRQLNSHLIKHLILLRRQIKSQTQTHN